MYAYDGADPNFSLSAAKAAGGIAVTVYIVGTPGGFPHATAARVADIRAHGMGAYPNWERAADFFAHCTLEQARTAGAEGLSACQSLGFPADGTIQVAYSFDFDVPASRFAEMGQKVDAVQAGLNGHYHVAVYGPQALIDYLVAHGHVKGKQWLMMSTFNHAYNPRSQNVCMVQGHDVNGNWIKTTVAGTDINTVTDPEALGAWWPDNSPYGGSMPLTDADVNDIWNGTKSRITLDDGKTIWTASHVLKRAYTQAEAALEVSQGLSKQVADLTAQVAALTEALHAGGGGGAGIPAHLKGTVSIDLAPAP